MNRIFAAIVCIAILFAGPIRPERRDAMVRVIAVALVVIFLAGCKTADGPFHDWKPPGMLMQLPVDKGSL